MALDNYMVGTAFRWQTYFICENKYLLFDIKGIIYTFNIELYL